MGYIGNTYTWSNNRRDAGYIAAWLDRALCNHLWHSASRDPTLTHMPKYSSNHCPLFLSFNQRLTSVNAPFKFEAMWLQHPDFLSLVVENWNCQLAGNPQYVLAHKLKSSKLVLKGWNKLVFGDIQIKVQNAEQKVLDLQELLDRGPLDSLHQSLAKAKSNLRNCLQQKETHWRQKSRIRWLKEGDRNSAFFHAYAKSCGAVNRINRILHDATWVEDQSQIQSLAVHHFSSMASSIHLDPSESLFGLESNKVSPQQNSFLTTTPGEEEIRRVVFDLKRDSSPGPDGFSGQFYIAT
ncbi:hypothetical protein AAC387_Pa09g0713 [Persea americana]